MTDVEKLRNAIKQFERRASPSNANGSSLCTNDDINKLIRELSHLLNIFVSELDKK